MPCSCAVFGCYNTLKNTNDFNPQLQFYRFSTKPWNQDQMKKWILFAKRKGANGCVWNPTKNSRICSVHFVGNRRSHDPNSPSFNPSIYPKKCSKNQTYKLQRYERIKKRKQIDENTHILVEDHVPEAVDGDFVVQQNISSRICVNEIETQTNNSDQLCATEMTIFISTSINGNACCQVTHSEKKNETINRPCMEDKCVGNDIRSSIFCGYETVRHNEKLMKDLTGISFNIFSILLMLLPNTVVINEISWENRLLLFLIKLKSNMTYTCIGSLFGVAPNTCSRTFTSVLYLIVNCTKDWIVWPSKEAIKLNMPPSFQCNYPNCRGIIDCTEVKTERPPGVEKQVKLWSSYKSSWTVKFLVCITPCGLISFISKAYGGRSSDAFITNNCGILDKFECGDEILADKGFPHVQVNEGVTVVMPPFSSSSQSQFSTNQMNETYKVASVRIHVERAIQRLKIFNILQNRLSVDLLPHIDAIFHACSILTNLSSPIIKAENK